MTGIEILLLVIGVVFFVASFFIAEKLSPNELGKIGELSNEEIQKVMERELQRISGSIGDRVEEKVENVLVKSSQSMEDECNDKIRAISEYSDTIIESMNKTHNEIMFLYSMLNDKHAELTKFSARLQELTSEIAKKDEEIQKHIALPVRTQEPKPAARVMMKSGIRKAKAKGKAEAKPTETRPGEVKSTEVKKPEKEEMNRNRVEEEPADLVFEDFDMEMEHDMEAALEEEKDFNHNQEILSLHREGKTALEIARELALGLGEVQLVIGLYEGNRKK